MKPFTHFTKKKPVPKPKVKHDYRRPPTPIPKEWEEEDLCRILPHYIANNYAYFELLSLPKRKIIDWAGYVLRIKKRITNENNYSI